MKTKKDIFKVTVIATGQNTMGGFVFYGSYDNTGKGKTPAQAKEEAKTYFLTNVDFKNEEDCNTGYATIKNMEQINIGLMPGSGNIKPESSKNIEGTFYMSTSGNLIARPKTGSGGANDFKIGFVWEK